MKTIFKSLLICIFIMPSYLIYAQTGINTANPQAPFHVDGAKDNPSAGIPSGAQQSNDFVVTSSGNVGLGTTSPSTKLSIENGTNNGAIRITDGTQGAGKVLTSDANGTGTWNVPGVASYIGVWNSTYEYKPLSANPVYNGLSISNIPPGRYYVVISVGTAIASNSASSRYVNYGFTPSTPSTNQATKHFLGDIPNLGTGRWVVENTSWIIDITSTSSLYFFQMDTSGIGATIGCCSDQFSAIAIKLN